MRFLNSLNCNIETFDKILRRSLGLILLGLGIYYQHWWGALGLLPIALSYWKHFPLYLPFKINTNKENKDHA